MAANPAAFVPDWMREAACAKSDLTLEHFFPERGESTRAAKAVCASCPVRVACSDYAVDNFIGFGIWGGMSGRERQRIQRRQQRRKPPVRLDRG